MNIDALLLERIAARTIESDTGCLEWHGSMQRGYGCMSVSGRQMRVHRIMCEWENGPQPAGKPWALHKCNNKACVRPDHLYWGDIFDNARDAVDDGVQYSPFRGVTHCKQGHEFTVDNTYRIARASGIVERKCKECNRTRAREWARKHRASA